MIPPLKHVVDDLLNIPAATASVQIVTLAVGTVNPNYVVNNNNVRNGSLVTKMTLLLDISPSGGLTTDASFNMYYDWYICFNIAGAQVLPAPNSVGGSVLAPQIFKQEQGIFAFANAVQTSYPAPHVLRIDLSIPRSYQRINDTDTIEFRIQKSVMTSQALNIKLKCIYKEIFP